MAFRLWARIELSYAHEAKPYQEKIKERDTRVVDRAREHAQQQKPGQRRSDAEA